MPCSRSGATPGYEFDVERCADVLLTFRLLLGGYTYHHIPRSMYRYRDTPGSYADDAEAVAASLRAVHAEAARLGPERYAAAWLQIRDRREGDLHRAWSEIAELRGEAEHPPALNRPREDAG